MSDKKWPEGTEPVRRVVRQLVQMSVESDERTSVYMHAPAKTRRLEVVAGHAAATIAMGILASVLADLARDAPNIANEYAARVTDRLEDGQTVHEINYEIGAAAGLDMSAEHHEANILAANAFNREMDA
ncbi:hypothetical protein C5E10_06220 [Pseudoclavibacter sp. RFBG4]|uniref:hypothetical protein n=1 Tax=Pseudoclavibacter sp. RFBG4 TaxID=2080575 RepID=UPI000CE92D96|nr:hypothetical protein [Pseudoclavibacter sp. RFBG4]PPG35183.1 hypothetical protein C5E10_06220 [Pseudoclavibacter sp. RFBG4]